MKSQIRFRDFSALRYIFSQPTRNYFNIAAQPQQLIKLIMSASEEFKLIENENP
jgi:hypothetical protein